MDNYQKKFSEGFIFFQNNLPLQIASKYGISKSSNYISEINKAIDEAQEGMLASVHPNEEIPVASGHISEEFHLGTYNINAKLNESTNYAIHPEETFASPDIILSSGEKFGLKYLKTPKKTALAQAESYCERHKADKSNLPFEEWAKEKGINTDEINKHASIYEGQLRIVPKDQINEIIKILRKEIIKKENMGYDTTGLKETLSNITVRIHSSDGIESLPLSKEDAMQLAELAQNGNLDIRNFEINGINGIKTETLVNNEYILKQGLNAGITAAVISMVLRLAPEIYKAIDKIIKDGEITLNDIEDIGSNSVKSAGLGFINGAVSASITTACLAGTFGSAWKSINPSVIGTLTVILTNTISYTIKLANHKIDKDEFSKIVSKDIFLSICSIGLGSLTQGLIPFGFLIGSFIGSLAGNFIYEKTYSSFMSLCCETGFTCFGLVEQDYKIPKEILDSMNIESFDFDTFDFDSFKFDTFEFDSFEFETFNYNTIGLKVMRRDVIGVFKIGYSV